MRLVVLNALMIFLISSSSCKNKDNENDVKPIPLPPSIHSNLKIITLLDSNLDETSGLLFFNNRIFTHNDRGWPNEIYTIDTLNGNIGKTIILSNAESIDYEDMAESPNHIFISDAGNNFGDRDDLCIYRVNKQDLIFNGDTIYVNTEKISFEYEDQILKSHSKDHNFDCEAVVFYNDSLFLFTKNRLDLKTNLYAIPNLPGHHTAKLISSFDSKGLITGADISSNGSKLVLIGYNKSEDVFLWIFSNYYGSNFFSGTPEYINLGPFSCVGQAEAVCFYEDNKLFISSEKITGKSAILYRMTF